MKAGLLSGKLCVGLLLWLSGLKGYERKNSLRSDLSPLWVRPRPVLRHVDYWQVRRFPNLKLLHKDSPYLLPAKGSLYSDRLVPPNVLLASDYIQR